MTQTKREKQRKKFNFETTEKIRKPYKEDELEKTKLLIRKTPQDPVYGGVGEIITNTFEHGRAEELNITYRHSILEMSEKEGKGIKKKDVSRQLKIRFLLLKSGKTFGQFHFGRLILLNITDCIYYFINDDKCKYGYFNDWDTQGFIKGESYKRRRRGVTVACKVTEENFNLDELKKYILEWFGYQLLSGKKISINGKYLQSLKNLDLKNSITVKDKYWGMSYKLDLWIDPKGPIRGGRGIRVLVKNFYVGEKIDAPHSSVKVVGFLHTFSSFTRDLALNKQLQKDRRFINLREVVLSKVRNLIQPLENVKITDWHEKLTKEIGKKIKQYLKPEEMKSFGDVKIGKEEEIEEKVKKPSGPHNYPKTRNPPRPRGITITYHQLGLEKPIVVPEIERFSSYKRLLFLNVDYPDVDKAAKLGISPKVFVQKLDSEIVRALEDLVMYDQLTEEERKTRFEYATKCDQRRFGIETKEA